MQGDLNDVEEIEKAVEQKEDDAQQIVNEEEGQ